MDGDNQGKEQREGQADEELVVIIAGGMTSQLTYDGIDVCASRVAWEVSVTHVLVLGLGFWEAAGRSACNEKERPYRISGFYVAYQ